VRGEFHGGELINYCPRSLPANQIAINNERNFKLTVAGKDGIPTCWLARSLLCPKMWISEGALHEPWERGSQELHKEKIEQQQDGTKPNCVKGGVA